MPTPDLSIKVTVEDTETGETEPTIVEDYLLIVAGSCYLATRQAYPNGTHVLTVKGATRPGYAQRTTFEPATTVQESTDKGDDHLMAKWRREKRPTKPVSVERDLTREGQPERCCCGRPGCDGTGPWPETPPSEGGTPR